MIDHLQDWFYRKMIDLQDWLQIKNDRQKEWSTKRMIDHLQEWSTERIIAHLQDWLQCPATFWWQSRRRCSVTCRSFDGRRTRSAAGTPWPHPLCILPEKEIKKLTKRAKTRKCDNTCRALLPENKVEAQSKFRKHSKSRLLKVRFSGLIQDYRTSTVQWGMEYWPFENPKHMNTNLFEVRISNVWIPD